MAASGVQSLLKTFGVDPEQIKQEVRTTVDGFAQEMRKLNEHMARIEEKLNIILERTEKDAIDSVHEYPSDVQIAEEVHDGDSSS